MPTKSAAPDAGDIETILKGIVIPSPPQLIADLQMEMVMPDPDLNAMAGLISKDPGLAGGVLKTINSPFYGNRTISSISQAVMMLGMNTVMNIINTLYLREASFAENLSEQMHRTLNKFWDSATDVARCCMMIAQRIRMHDADLAYMLGLFHNAGIPLLLQRFDQYPEIMESAYLCQETRLVDTENRVLNTNHAVMSFYVARSWKLPVLLCEAIHEHHNTSSMFDYASTASSEKKTLVAILKLAEHIVALYRILGNQQTDCEWQKNSEQIMDYLGLSEYDYEELLSYASELGIGDQSYFM